jgi:MoaA/NifB/PqqE/SkfB family radical SAM enzyme
MVTVFIGFSCSNECVFCAQGRLRDRETPPSDAEVRRRLKEAVSSAEFNGRLAFVGGEPTLRPELPAWISEARRLGVKEIVLQTNGRRLSQRGFARSLAQSGLDEVEVALQGSTPAMHDYHTGRTGSFAETVAGMRAAAGAHLTVRATTVVTRSNFRHLDEIVRLARTAGARAIRLEPAAALGRAAEQWDRVVPDPDIISSALLRARELARSLRMEAPDRPFAGLGPVEEPRPDAAAAKTETAPGRRPRPGAREVRVPAKKTGEALREIFPNLFQEGNG